MAGQRGHDDLAPRNGRPGNAAALLSLGLVLYAGWHFTKAAFFRPESPFDWMPAERDLLLAMPLRPRDLVAYQLASVTVTTILKAGLFTLLLLPDLRCVPLAFLGLVLATMTLEILRLAIDIATWSMVRSAYLAYRAVVLTGLVVAGIAVGAMIVREDALVDQTVGGEGSLQRLLAILVRLNASEFGYLALPCQPFLDLVQADALTAPRIVLAAAASAAVTGIAAAVIGFYVSASRCMSNRERCNYCKNGAARERLADTDQHEIGLLRAAGTLKLQPIPRWGGVGALAWRQLVGARRHWGSLLTAMIAPAVLACAPCFAIADPAMALLATIGTLAFYTFLLLPTALRFDFRRDLDRLATLKGLPIAPAAAAIGQTLAPVLIATVFQGGVLAFAIFALSLPLHQLFVALLVMIPLNVLVFGLDNLIYLLYPYRMQQEGLEIFVRTMLTFTGKGLLFVVGMVAIAGWGFGAAAVTAGIAQWSSNSISALPAFIGGIVAGLSLLAGLTLYGLGRTYRQMDPIESMPR